MPKMTMGELKALLAAERYSALSAMTASKLSDERATALNYYYGDMSKDMPAPEGRSRAVSTDVADTIEGLMPTLMEIFCGGDEVVRFEPVGAEDLDVGGQLVGFPGPARRGHRARRCRRRVWRDLPGD